MSDIYKGPTFVTFPGLHEFSQQACPRDQDLTGRCDIDHTVILATE